MTCIGMILTVSLLFIHVFIMIMTIKLTIL